MSNLHKVIDKYVIKKVFISKISQRLILNLAIEPLFFINTKEHYLYLYLAALIQVAKATSESRGLLLLRTTNKTAFQDGDSPKIKVLLKSNFCFFGQKHTPMNKSLLIKQKALKKGI